MNGIPELEIPRKRQFIKLEQKKKWDFAQNGATTCDRNEVISKTNNHYDTERQNNRNKLLPFEISLFLECDDYQKKKYVCLTGCPVTIIGQAHYHSDFVLFCYVILCSFLMMLLLQLFFFLLPASFGFCWFLFFSIAKNSYEFEHTQMDWITTE